MSRVETIDGKRVFVIEYEPGQGCDGCGQVRELRPYGKDGACICTECAMDDPEWIKRFHAILEECDEIRVSSETLLRMHRDDERREG